jgi:hypothetical protein
MTLLNGPTVRAGWRRKDQGRLGSRGLDDSEPQELELSRFEAHTARPVVMTPWQRPERPNCSFGGVESTRRGLENRRRFAIRQPQAQQPAAPDETWWFDRQPHRLRLHALPATYLRGRREPRPQRCGDLTRWSRHGRDANPSTGLGVFALRARCVRNCWRQRERHTFSSFARVGDALAT